MVDLKTTTINRATKCSQMDAGTLTIHGFVVLDQRTEERKALDAFVEGLDHMEWDSHNPSNKEST